MTMNDSLRTSAQEHWLGGEMSPELEALELAALAGGAAALERQEVRDYESGLGGRFTCRARRLVLAYSPTAVITLAERMQSENEEVSRKAAVDLLRHFNDAAREELAAEAARREAEEQGLVAALTDEEVERLLTILAEARARQGNEQQRVKGER